MTTLVCTEDEVRGVVQVELVRPPEGSVVGERARVEGLEGEPLTPAQVEMKRPVFPRSLPVVRLGKGLLDQHACISHVPTRFAVGGWD